MRRITRLVPPMLGAAALVAALLTTLIGAATASASAALNLSASVKGQTATITYSTNHAANKIRSQLCTLTGPTTSTACGSPSATAKRLFTYQAVISGLAPGSYSYSVQFTFTDRDKVSGSTGFTVGGTAQTVSFTSTNPTPVTVGDPGYTPTATASSGLPVTITLDASSSGCTLLNGVVSFPASGTCVIDANQAGDSTHTAAPQAQQTIAIGLASQTVSFTSTPPSSATVGDPGYTPTATASSGLPVTITLDASSSGCTLLNGVVSFPASGTCVIDANQAGDSTHTAAQQVQQNITVVAAGGGGGGCSTVRHEHFAVSC